MPLSSQKKPDSESLVCTVHNTQHTDTNTNIKPCFVVYKPPSIAFWHAVQNINSPQFLPQLSIGQLLPWQLTNLTFWRGANITPLQSLPHIMCLYGSNILTWKNTLHHSCHHMCVCMAAVALATLAEVCGTKSSSAKNHVLHYAAHAVAHTHIILLTISGFERNFMA